MELKTGPFGTHELIVWIMNEDHGLWYELGAMLEQLNNNNKQQLY